jgi:outer membrane protein OmpA-like peptidoglycan-associated protein
VKTYVVVTTEANASPVVATVSLPTNSGVNNNASVQVVSNPTAVSLIDAGSSGAVSVTAAVNAVVQLTSTLFASTDVVQAYLQTPDGTWIDLGQGAVNADGTLALPALKLTKAGAYNIVFTLVGQVQTAGVTPRYGSLTQSTLIKVGSVKPAKTTVLFARDSAVLSKAVQAAIKAWVKLVGKSRTVFVDGYANGINLKTGKADKAPKAIALARAKAVAKFLKALGVNSNVTGYAATKPASKKLISQNRRAVLSVK